MSQAYYYVNSLKAQEKQLPEYNLHFTEISNILRY